MISACAVNSDHAPWDDAKWFSAGQVAVSSYLAIAKPETCPIFQEQMGNILMDYEENHATDEFVDLAWSSLADVWLHKNPKIGMRTWFHYIRSMGVFLQKWHSRLVIVWYLCLTQDMLKHGPVELKTLLATGAAEDFLHAVFAHRWVLIGGEFLKSCDDVCCEWPIARKNSWVYTNTSM